MGGNGSFKRGETLSAENRKYETVFMIGNNIAILEQKDKRKGTKLPEESHTPGRTYAAFRKDGKDVKLIAVYNGNGIKLYEIHTDDHRGLRPHYHPWKDGKPDKEIVLPLTEEMENILRKSGISADENRKRKKGIKPPGVD